MNSIWQLSRKILWFYLGLTITTMGYAMTIKASVGVGPWDVFHLGTHTTLGIPLFLTYQGVGLLVILVNLTLGIRPTVGMVLNMASMGPIMHVCLQVLPTPSQPVGSWLIMVVGVLVAGLGTALYASADLGTGPRDGMMIGLTRRLNRPVGFVKNGIDVLVTTCGWLLGGPVGPGTIFVVLTLGHSIALGMAVVTRLAVLSPFNQFLKPVSMKNPVNPAAAEAK